MSFTFSLIFNRELTEDEKTLMQGDSCAKTTFESDTLPTNAEVPVTRMEFDDDITDSLAEAIEAGFAVAKKVEGLTIPGLIVPAQPAEKVVEAASDDVSVAQLEQTEAVEVAHAE